MRCEEDVEILRRRRQEEETSHLDLAATCFEERKEVEAAAAMEHPHPAESWKTQTMEKMKGYLEVVVDRCRTGLLYYVKYDQMIGKVRKGTRLRTTSRILAEAMAFSATAAGRMCR